MRLPVSLAYTVTRRSRCAGGTKKYVSFIRNGPVIRVRMNSSSETRDTFSTTQPRMSVLYPYTHASPGWRRKGSDARRSIVEHTGSSLSAVYHPHPAAGPSPFSRYRVASAESVPYEIPAV